MVSKKIDLVRKDMSNRLMILWSNRKEGGVPTFGRKRSCLKRNKGYNTGKEGHGSRHSFTK